ncbi:MAG: EpsI family protein, partial [Giesbergeria sp.]|nr:EpsI family protein [Giesbergeria sp.]
VLRNIEINKNWQPDDVSSNDWKPSFPSAVSFYDNIYTAKENSRVGLHISYYRQQNYQSKLITSTNTLLNAEDKRLRKISTENANFQLNEKTLSVESSLLKFNGILEEKENTNILAWKFYWVDGKFTANKFYAKILGALSQIKGKGDDGAIIVVYAKFYDDQAYAKKALESFMKDNEKNIENALLKTKNN